MTFQEYARRILLSDRLEDKIAIEPLADLSDSGNGPVDSPDAPGRPEVLRFRPRGERLRAELPSRPQLVDDENRGVLLHFFANHELLAAELMALALLKFPDAPRAFRRGLMNTLREEQRHTTWYVNRMRECGVNFGDFPVSRFFWDAVAPMETPLDYVTRLSLTFEQANLDYSRYYAGVLGEAGDEKSAKILERIYQDEIAHVGYGLKWFRKWKSGEDTDWEAFQKQLIFPLSPSRAKSSQAAFNIEGRRDAGFDEDFIEELSVFERSRGRTPNVFWFNPDAEDAMAGGLESGGYRSTRKVEQFIRDLEWLPAFLARRDDVVLVRESPSREWRERMQQLGFDLPEFEELGAGDRIEKESLLAGRKLNQLRPWSWDPRSAALLSPLEKNLPGNSEPVRWSPKLRELFSKAAQVECFGPGMGDAVVCRSEEELDAAVDSMRQSFGGTLVLKSPFAASGRGHCLLASAQPFEGPIRAGRVKSLTRQGAVVVEPWVERVFDFSVQFEMTAGGLKRLGFTRQEIDARGGYRGTVVGPKFCRGLEADLARFLMEEALAMYEPESELVRQLGDWLESAEYRGPVGVDAFVYRDSESGSLTARPVCEINPRYTMGRLALELSRKVAPGRWVRFSIERRRKPECDPARLSLDAEGRLESGEIPLNDPVRAISGFPCVEVAKDPARFQLGAGVSDQ